jgi:hypothetical protein
MTRSSDRSRLEITPARDEHAAALATFYATVWNAESSAEDVLRARVAAAEHNPVEPGATPPIFLAVQDGRVLGHVACTPIWMWNGQTTYGAYWIRDLVVLPEYRNGPIGFGVLKAAAASLERSAVLTIVPASLRLFGALGYEDLGAVPHFLRVVTPGRLLARLELGRLDLEDLPSWMPPALRVARWTGLSFLLGGMGGLLVRAAAAAVRLPAFGLRERAAWPPDASVYLDRLWETVRGSLGPCVVRDGAYLLDRYGPPGAREGLQWVGVWRGDQLQGVAVVGSPRDDEDGRLPGARVVTIEDILVDPGGPACLSLLGAVERRARHLQADVVVARMSASALRRPLKLQGYLPVPGNVHFFIRDVSSSGPHLHGPLGSWWLARGDG